MFCYGSLWECFIFGLVLLVLSGCFGNVVGNVCGDLLVKKGCLFNYSLYIALDFKINLYFITITRNTDTPLINGLVNQVSTS